MLGHPCPGSSHPQPQLLPSVYQAALNHAGSYGHGRAISHTPWEAVTFVAVSAVIGVIYHYIIACLYHASLYDAFVLVLFEITLKKKNLYRRLDRENKMASYIKTKGF
jgi:hypothetical protein